MFEKHRDNIHKVVYLRDLLDAVANNRMQARLDEIAHEPFFVPQYQKIDELFSELRSRKLQCAIVVDEYGTVRGIVTLEDLVGEIYDERPKCTPAPVRSGQHTDNLRSLCCGFSFFFFDNFFLRYSFGHPVGMVIDTLEFAGDIDFQRIGGEPVGLICNQPLDLVPGCCLNDLIYARFCCNDFPGSGIVFLH